MIDFCFFLNQQNKIKLFPSLTNAISVVSESVEQTCGMKGKRQLSVVRREEGDIKQCFVVFNYVYGSSSDSFGICLVIRDHYPQNIRYLFSYFSNQIKEIIEEGKILYVDNQGEIKAEKITSEKIPAILIRHLDNIKGRLDKNKIKLASLTSITNNYFKTGKFQTCIYELSDDTWKVAEALNYNNVVIVTEEIEEENIHKYKNVVRQKNEEIKSLKEELNTQKAKNRQLKAQKSKYGWVIVLLLLSCISIVTIFVLSDELNTSKELHEITKNTLEDSLKKKKKKLEEFQIAYINEKEAHSDLQSKYSQIESNLKEEQSNRIAIENMIQARQPFVITSISYDRPSGSLSISYYGVESGTYKVNVKGLYIKSNYTNDTKRSYDYGSYDLCVEKGLHTCNIPIGRHYTKYYVLMQGNRIIGGDVN